MYRFIFTLAFTLLFSSCYTPERNCADFKNGSFTFTTELNGVKETTRFTRNGEIEIDYYQGKADSASIRWINDCEYVVKKLHPKNRAEEKPVHMKIVSTASDRYVFEYSIVGDSKKLRGTAIKTN